MSLSILALIIVGVIFVYAVAFTLVIMVCGKKSKDKNSGFYLKKGPNPLGIIRY